MMRLRYWVRRLVNPRRGMVGPATRNVISLIVGLEEMWTELYAPKTIVCHLRRTEGREIDDRPI
jgi:hypothetical protein